MSGCKPCATSAAVGKSCDRFVLPIGAEGTFAAVPQAGLVAESLLLVLLSLKPRGWGCMIFPGGAGTAAGVVPGVGPGDGFEVVPTGCTGPDEELVDGGRDHPGPVMVERGPSAVSFAVTSLEWDDAV